MVRERVNNGISGWLMLVIGLAVPVAGIYLTVRNVAPSRVPIELIIAIPLFILIARGFFIVAPNQAVVLQLFGSYAGSGKEAGLRWANPLYSKRRLSLRVRNFESAHLKVNDANANPIEIAAVIVWKVVETAEALFEVDDYENYIKVQTEAALRNLATSYPYDGHDKQVASLMGTTGAVAEHLKQEVQQRLAKAGVEVIEARISHLAYAQEIAAAMLQRQQAGAIIAARQQIVEGAVGMVEMALQMLSGKGIVHLDEERKAAMVSNLLVVLCGERGTQPVVNTGSIYQ
jgi:regulator of protease activity HflC (stomatin/prohibitin superfamily)